MAEKEGLEPLVTVIREVELTDEDGKPFDALKVAAMCNDRMIFSHATIKGVTLTDPNLLSGINKHILKQVCPVTPFKPNPEDSITSVVTIIDKDNTAKITAYCKNHTTKTREDDEKTLMSNLGHLTPEDAFPQLIIRTETLANALCTPSVPM